MRLTKKLSDQLNVAHETKTNSTGHLVEYRLTMPGGSLGGLRKKTEKKQNRHVISATKLK